MNPQNVSQYKCKLIRLALILSCVVCYSAESRSSDAFFYKEVLDNGLRCIVEERPGTGTVSINVRLNIGSVNEGRFIGYGITHLIEHMCIKSTVNYKPGQILEEVKAIGGTMNATTSLDTTSFFITAQSEYFPKALVLLKEMVFNANFPEQAFEDEKNVILKEMLLNEDRPDRKVNRLLWETAYIVHPYRHPIIGYPELFKSLTRDDVIEYYNSRFVPNNMAIAIVGDVKEDEVVTLVKEVFSDVRTPNYQTTALPQEPPQITQRYGVEKSNIKLARMAIGFHSTQILHNDLYAMDLLAIILGQGDDSRLNKKLVKELELVHSVYSFNHTPRDKGTFVITAVLKPENIENVKSIILEELNLFKKSPPSSEELQRAKNIITSGYIYSRESIGGIASELTMNDLLTGEPDFQRKYIEKLKDIDPHQISQVAERYFDDENLSFAELLPREYRKEDKTAPIKPVIPNKDITKKIVLDNGITLIVTKNSSTPSAFITAAFLGGLRAESAKLNGISNMTASMFLKGTSSKDESQIKAAFEKKGGSISTFNGSSSLGITIQVLKKDIAFALDMLEDVTRNPVFPQVELDKVRKRVLSAIRLAEENIFARGPQELSKILYKDHPYAMNELGTNESVTAITREDLFHFFKEFCVTSNMVISVCGDLEPDAIIDELKARFFDFKKVTNAGILAKKNVDPLLSHENSTIIMDKNEALVLFGFLGVSIDNDDQFALSVLASIMSGHSGRLFQNIRNVESLSYTQGFFSRF